MSALSKAQEFVSWLRQAGGQFNDSAEFTETISSGLSVVATRDIAPGSTLISCPFNIAITSQVGLEALQTIYPNAKEVEGWSERMLVASYLVLHWLHAKDTPLSLTWPKVLRHSSYLAVLPSPQSLLTPLHFSPAEKELLKGTNLAGVVEDREKELQEEFAKVKVVLANSTWRQYRDAVSYISSRAFPSTLLAIPQNGEAKNTADSNTSPDSYPVLIPGLDLFNHSRATPITWLSSPVDTPTGPVPSVSFLNPEAIAAGKHVFNNYGPKSNEELLLSYGFVLDPNPDDTVILRLAAPPDAVDKLKSHGLDHSARFALRRDGVVPQELLKVLRAMLGGADAAPHVHGEKCDHDHDHDDDDGDDDDDDEDMHAEHEKEMAELELEIDVLGQLGSMLDVKLEKMDTDIEADESGVREDVQKMIEIYRKGQEEIIEKTQDTLGERIDRLEGLIDQGMGECPCGC